MGALLAAALPRSLLESRKWRQLRPTARAVLIEIALNFDGVNNGAIRLSVAEAIYATRTSVADSDEAGHAFQSEAGHLFQSEAGQGSDLKPATCRLLPQVGVDDVLPLLIGQERLDFMRRDVAFAGSLRLDRSDRRCG
jgi:hypothetical protein